MNTEAPTTAPVDGPVRRLLRTLPPTTRGHTFAVIGEFVGTISFLFFAFAGTQYVLYYQCLLIIIATLLARCLPYTFWRLNASKSTELVSQLCASHDKGMLIAGDLLQSCKYIFKYQHRDYRHHKSRAEEPVRTTLY